MKDFVAELYLALEVLKHWETLVALVGFILVWNLFRYVALIRRRSPGYRMPLPRKPAKPPGIEPTEAEADSEREESEGKD